MFNGLESAEDLGVQMKSILPAMQEVISKEIHTIFALNNLVCSVVRYGPIFSMV